MNDSGTGGALHSRNVALEVDDATFVANQLGVGNTSSGQAIYISGHPLLLSSSIFCSPLGDDTSAGHITGFVQDDGGNCFSDECTDLDDDGIPDRCDPSVCFADFNGDGVVDGVDLALLLGGWGVCSDAECPYDIDGSGLIDGADLTLFLGSWGACL